jgi:hypothetical protein
MSIQDTLGKMRFILKDSLLFVINICQGCKARLFFYLIE